MNKISIIIPILNEADAIGRILSYIIENTTTKNIAEIIVVDGGSTDGSQDRVIAFNEVKLLHSDCGRAKQMNVGAGQAQGDILYFVHSDSFPPKGFDQLIIDAVRKNNQAGCFRLQFDYVHPMLMVSQWFTRFNHISCRGGDQSLFVTKELFDKIGGYNEAYVIYEDNEIVKRLYALNQFVVIPENLITSARRYRENGVWRLQYHFVIIHLKHWLGHSMESMVSYFRANIK